MSLFVLALAGTGFSSCLLSSPADYEGEERIPPRLDLLSAYPEPYLFHEKSPGEQLEFKVKVQSNDTSATGDARLQVVLFLNFNNYQGDSDQILLDSTSIDPATFEDGPREIRMTYTLGTYNENDGCYQYTLFVTHWDNGYPPADIDDPEDVAIVSWWINVEGDDEPNDVRDCLTSGAQ